MTAANHALTGALIGLAVGNPAVAVPLAFVSHFVLDAVPHYDPPGDSLTRIRSHRFLYEQLIANAILCIVLVVALALSRPAHWLTAAFSAFAAASPDLMWIPKFIMAKRQNRLRPNGNWLTRFHSRLQWRTGPELWWFELLIFACLWVVLGVKLWQTGS
jgi:hypothetical protein